MLSSFRFLIQVVNSYQYNLTRFSTKIIEVKELYFEEKKIIQTLDFGLKKQMNMKEV